MIFGPAGPSITGVPRHRASLQPNARTGPASPRVSNQDWIRCSRTSVGMRQLLPGHVRGLRNPDRRYRAELRHRSAPRFPAPTRVPLSTSVGARTRIAWPTRHDAVGNFLSASRLRTVCGVLRTDRSSQKVRGTVPVRSRRPGSGRSQPKRISQRHLDTSSTASPYTTRRPSTRGRSPGARATITPPSRRFRST